MVEAPRRWDFLAGLMNQLEFKTFVEVGCKEGRTSGHILDAVKESLVIAIDPWITQEANGDPKRETYKDWDFEEIEKKFWENVGERRDRCRMLRMTSAEAVLEVGDGVDVVFIDALHDYESVKEDIKLWWPKVKVGGVLSGHDFNHKWPGVQLAVAEAFNLMDVGVGPDSVWFMVKNDDAHAA
jgi:hypothetical protein